MPERVLSMTSRRVLFQAGTERQWGSAKALHAFIYFFLETPRVYFCFAFALLILHLTTPISLSLSLPRTVSAQVLPAVGSRRRSPVELQLGVPAASAHEVPPLPHPAVLWRGDARELELPAEEEDDQEEEFVRNI